MPKYWKNIVGGECNTIPTGIIKTGVALATRKVFAFAVDRLSAEGTIGVASERSERARF
jgi:hypothetical protein